MITSWRCGRFAGYPYAYAVTHATHTATMARARVALTNRVGLGAVGYFERGNAMKILELNRSGGAIGKALLYARSIEPPRPGVHCSTIVNDILKTLNPKRYSQEIADETMLSFQAFGNIAEDIIAAYLVKRIAGWVKPTPRKSATGIWGSPDGWAPRSRTIYEIKTTWVSEKDFLTSLKLLGYLKQSMFYADVWGATRIRLLVLFVCGSYPRGTPFPVPREYTVLFTRAEAHEWHRQLAQHGLDMGLPVRLPDAA